MKYRLPNRLWDRRFKPSYSSDNLEASKELTVNQLNAIELVGSELFGSLEFFRQWEQRSTPFTKEDQAKIDTAWQEFSIKYQTPALS